MSESNSKLLTTKPKKMAKKPPKSQPINQQDPKKLTTKEMINVALKDMKSRKGTSLYAIKKYLEDKFNVDVEKVNYLIKKSLKDSIQAGDIVQTKGIGATGSFKLASKEKKKTMTKEKSKKEEKEKIKKSSKDEKIIKKVIIDKKEKTVEVKKVKKVKSNKPATIAKGLQTPKKTAMMKRKSIGSIIKKPKMKPKKA